MPCLEKHHPGSIALPTLLRPAPERTVSVLTTHLSSEKTAGYALNLRPETDEKELLTQVRNRIAHTKKAGDKNRRRYG